MFATGGKRTFKPYRATVNWLLLLAAIVADHVITEAAIRRHGVDIEGNPLFHWTWRRFGGFGSLLIQAAILFPLLWAVESLFPNEALLLPAAIWLTVVSNVVVLGSRK
jgi:hypothetical protein